MTFLPGKTSPAASPDPLTPEQERVARLIAAEGLAIQDRFVPQPLYKTTGKGHYESSTVEEIRKARGLHEKANP